MVPKRQKNVFNYVCSKTCFFFFFNNFTLSRVLEMIHFYYFDGTTFTQVLCLCLNLKIMLEIKPSKRVPRKPDD